MTAGQPAGDESLRQRYPLPEGVADVVLNRDELAEALGVTANTIDAWRRAGMPVLSEGGSGRAYEYQLADCWAWRHARLDAQRAETDQKRHAIRQARLALQADDQFDEFAELTPQARKAEYEAAVHYARAAQEQGDLVKVAEVRMLIEGLHGLTRRFALNAPDHLERILGLDPAQTERVSEWAHQWLASYRAMIEGSNLVKVQPQGTASARNG